MRRSGRSGGGYCQALAAAAGGLLLGRLRGTRLQGYFALKNPPPVGPYSSPMPRALEMYGGPFRGVTVLFSAHFIGWRCRLTLLPGRLGGTRLES